VELAEDHCRLKGRNGPPLTRGCEPEPDTGREGNSDGVVAGEDRERQRTSSTAVITVSISSSVL
jgi:hypothetical protein